MSSKQRIGRQKITLSLTHGAGATTASAAVKLNGLLLQAIIITPASVDGSATATINVLDADGNTVYTKAGLAANTTTKDSPSPSTPLSGSETVQVVFSAAQTVTDTTTSVVLLVDRG